MLLANKRVAIIGAGPVGLTMANLLQQKGMDVIVYERDQDPQARIWGGTLDLHESSGQQAMKKTGLLESYFQKAVPMGRTLADEHGKILLVKEPQYDSPEINRNVLRKLLLDNLTRVTVVWNSKLTELEEHDGKWLLHFENKPDATADFIIGANGGMSKIRKYVTDAIVEDTGTFIIQGEVLHPEINCPEFYTLCNNNIFMTASEGNMLVSNPRNNGVLTYSVFFKKPEEWILENGLNFQDTSNICAFLLKRFINGDERYKQLFKVTSSFWGLPTRKLPLDQAWKKDRPLPVTLIGDAAHLMPPFAGQGVNTGMLDTVILSDNLTNEKFDTIESALSDYEQQMFVYAKAAQSETSKNEIEMRSPGFSFQNRFRN